MKKFLFLIAILAAALSSCTESGEIDLPQPVISIIDNGNTSELTFPSEASEQIVAFKSNYDWTATTSDEWIKVSPNSGNAGDNCKVTVSIEENDSYDTRQGQVTISIDGMSIDLAVSQDQKSALLLSTKQVKLPQAGGTFEVVVASNINFTYTIKADWIKAATSRALKENTMRFEAEANPEVDSRKGEIIFKGGGYTETVTVTQSQNNVITLSTSTVEIDTNGGNFSVQVSSNIKYNVEIESGCDWISQIESRALTTTTLNFAVAENTSKKERSATISISGEGVSEKITVSQDYISPNPNSKIIYTSTNGDVVEPYDPAAFNANIISNTYSNGQGVIEFDADLTTIGKEAFYKSPTLMSISIPSTITSIGTDAFANCSVLTKLNISDLSAWCKIDFANANANPLSLSTRLYLNNVEITELNIPEDVTEIKPFAFRYFKRLKHLNIHDNISSIGDYAFQACSSLENIIIGDGVRKIGIRAFEACAMKELTIGKSLISISDYAFVWCEALETITISSYNITMGSDPFQNTTPTRVNIKITNWGGFCSNTLYRIPGEKHVYIDDKEITELVIPDNVTRIGEKAFYDFCFLTSISIPSSVTEIGSNAFNNCTGTLSINSKLLESDDSNLKYSVGNSSFSKIIIGDNITRIGDSAFYRLRSLKSVVMSDSITEIGALAFFQCENLTEINLSSNLTKIGQRAFCYCTLLSNVTFDNKLNSIGDRAFEQCTSLTKVVIPNSVTELGDYAFYGCSALIHAKIGNGVTNLGFCVFCDCSALTELAIGTGLTDVEENAFLECNIKKIYISDLKAWCKVKFEKSPIIPDLSTPAELYLNGTRIKDLTIPNGVTRIESYTFINFDITSISLPNSVTSIGAGTFAYNFNLKSVKLPDSIQTMDDAAFAFCTSLTEITLPEDLTSIGGGFYGISTINPGNGMGMVGGGSFVSEGVFGGCTGLTTITIPANVTRIEGKIFDGCENLQVYCKPLTPPSLYSVDFPATLKIYVPDAAFEAYLASWSNYVDIIYNDNGEILDGNIIYYTSSNGSIVTPIKQFGDAAIVSNTYENGQGIIKFSRNVTMVGDKTFYNKDHLTSITFPKYVTSIGTQAFAYCDNLESVTIPDSVTSIESEAFYQCYSLANVYCKPTTPPNLASSAFSGNASNRTIYVPKSSESAYKAVSNWTRYANYIVGYDF